MHIINWVYFEISLLNIYFCFAFLEVVYIYLIFILNLNDFIYFRKHTKKYIFILAKSPAFI